MKQILSLALALLPCLAWAQYPSNGNQKITLGEQTTADGLIYRGVLADTGIITPSSDTSAYIILDTVNHRFYNYNRATNVWSMAGVGSISSGLTGVLPVANGGTGQSTLTANKVLVGNGTTGILQPTNLHWDNTNSRLGIGTSSPKFLLSLFTSTDPQDSLGFTTYKSGSLAGGRQNGALKVVSKTNGAVFGVQNLDPTGFSGIEYLNNSSSLSVFTGFANSSDEYRVNNIAPNGFINFLINGNSKLYVKNNGNIGFSTNDPTARLHLAAGTATASTAPLKFTSQGASLLNPVEAGAVEFNGTNLLFTPSATRHTVNHGLTGSATLDFPSTNAQLSADLTITVTGAADGDVVSLGVPNAAVNANTSYSAWVSAANTVTVRFNNYSSGTVNPASGSFKVFVTK